MLAMTESEQKKNLAWKLQEMVICTKLPQRLLQRYETQADALFPILKECREALKENIWVNDGPQEVFTWCRNCGTKKEEEHKTGCQMGNALDSIEKLLGGK